MVLADQMAPGLNDLKQAALFAWGAYRHIAFKKKSLLFLLGNHIRDLTSTTSFFFLLAV